MSHAVDCALPSGMRARPSIQAGSPPSRRRLRGVCKPQARARRAGLEGGARPRCHVRRHLEMDLQQPRGIWQRVSSYAHRDRIAPVLSWEALLGHRTTADIVGAGVQAPFVVGPATPCHAAAASLTNYETFSEHLCPVARKATCGVRPSNYVL
eukprot:scaffold13628_cov31-Tisochrysis_lutea.AAC.5